MIPSLLFPLALAGLISVPALVGVYLFRNRFQPQVVSSLMLWVDPRESQEGGRKLRRLTTPLLFFLELLALLFLVFAATNPQIPLSTLSRPLVVVLDDSYSMMAGSDPAATPRALAAKALSSELTRQVPLVTRLLLASDRPRLLGPPMKSPAEIEAQLEGWTCPAGTANLDEAVMMAGQIGGPDCLVLVLTDRPPRVPLPDQGRVRWLAFGKARPNAAFVGASRGEKEGKDRILLEIANLSPAKRTIPVEVQTRDGGKSLLQRSLEIEAAGVARVIATLPKDTGPIQCLLEDTELPLDNRVELLPHPEKPVEIDNRLEPGPLREALTKALSATGLARSSAIRPGLILTDKEISEPPAGAWVVQWVADKDAVPLVGPFVIDRAHPLANGLSLAGVVWAAGKTQSADGGPVIMAGDVPLVSDREIPSEPPHRSIRIHFRPDLSTLFQSPDWPILVWNLVSWRSSQLPGLARPNLRLGDEALLRLERPVSAIKINDPTGKPREIAARGRQVGIPAPRVGLYELEEGTNRWTFAVNALNRDESDLSRADSGVFGAWAVDDSTRIDSFSLDWILALLALGAVTLHLVAMTWSAPRGDQGGARPSWLGAGPKP